MPVSGKTYYAVQGRGAYLREPSSSSGGAGGGAAAAAAATPPAAAAPSGFTTRQIRCKEFSPTDEGLVLVGSASHSSGATKDFVELFKEPRFKQLGSSLKLVMVAEGEAHIYPRWGSGIHCCLPRTPSCTSYNAVRPCAEALHTAGAGCTASAQTSRW